MNELKAYLRILIAAGCLSGLCLQYFNLNERYFKRHTQVRQIDVPKVNLQFPTISVCVDYFTSKEKLCRLFKNNCTKKAWAIMPLVFQQTYDAELRNMTAFDPEDLFSCQLRGSNSCNFNIDCAKAMTLTSLKRPLKMCYVLDIRTLPNFECREPWLLEVSLGTAIKARDFIIFLDSRTIPVGLVEPGTSPTFEIPSLDLRPGYSHEVTMQQQNFKRLPAPYESDCVDYDEMGHQSDVRGRHSMESCILQCLYRAEFLKCGCITYSHEFSAFIDHPICLDIHRGYDYCARLLQETGKYQECLSDCKIPCRETRYDVKLMRIGPIPNLRAAEKLTNFQMKLRFSTYNIEVLEVTPLIKSETLMAHMGGTFGVWIGISLIDILTWFVDSTYLVLRKLPF